MSKVKNSRSAPDSEYVIFEVVLLSILSVLVGDGVGASVQVFAVVPDDDGRDDGRVGILLDHLPDYQQGGGILVELGGFIYVELL